MAGVTLEGVTRLFGTKKRPVRAVDKLTLSVSDGEFIVLVGPSGCGKTTTLRLIAGLDEPTAGTVRIGGRVVNRVPPKDRDVAMVFQNHALYPHLTVFKNMAFGLRMRGVPRAETARKVGEAADRLGVTHLLDRMPSALSGGERQRVALGRVIVRRPQVFLFDEPLSNLDAKLRSQLRTELRELHSELRTTAIYVTHDQEEAMTLGDRLVILRMGVMQQCGAPLEVYNRPANTFVAGFVGTPGMNFLKGRLEPDGLTVCFVGRMGRLSLPHFMSMNLRGHAGQFVLLGIRPQHVRIQMPASEAMGRRSPDSKDSGHPKELRPIWRVGDGIVRHLEPLGDHVHVSLHIAGGESLAARVSAATSISPGQTVSVELDLSHAQVFSGSDGVNTHAAALSVDRSTQEFLA